MSKKLPPVRIATDRSNALLATRHIMENDILTVGDRLRRALNTLLIVTAAIPRGDADDLEKIEREAISDVISETYDELFWLTNLPDPLLDTPAPTDDQKSVLEHLQRVDGAA